jgi:hypothetical protein
VTTYSSAWRLALLVQADPAIRNVWGTPTTTDWTLVEAGATGLVGVPIGGLTSFTLTANNGAADQARSLIQNYTGTLTANCTVTLPGASAKPGWAINNTTGGFNVLLTSGGGAQATIPPNGSWYWHYSDGTGNVSLPSVGFGAVRTATTLNVGTNATIAGNATVTGTTTLSGLTTIQGAAAVKADGATYAISVTGNSGTTSSVNWNNVTNKPYIPNQNVDTGSSPSFNQPTMTSLIVPNIYGGAAGQAVALPNGLAGNLSLPSGYIGVAGSLGGQGSPSWALEPPGNVLGWAGPVSVQCAFGVEATFFGTFSDGRAKTDVTSIYPEEALDWLMRGRPVRYKMDGMPGAGFIAQEEMKHGRGDAITAVEDKDPRFAEADDVVRPGFRLVRNYHHDVAFLTAAIQGLCARIEALEAVASGYS